jgi:hypothetical protein
MRGETPSALGFPRASGGQSQPMNPVSASLGAAAIALALLTAGCGQDPREERGARQRHNPIVELDSPEAVVETVLNGRESMPAFERELPEQKIAAVITRLERGDLRRAGRRRTAELEVPHGAAGLLGRPEGERRRLAITLICAAALAPVAAALLRRWRGAGGEARMAVSVGGVLAGLFAVYLIWSIPPALAGTAVC